MSAGFVLGGIVGAVAGILLAPQSGEETRELISDTSKEWYDKAKNKTEDIQNKAEEVLSDIQEKGDEMLSKLQNFINKNKNEFEG